MYRNGPNTGEYSAQQRDNYTNNSRSNSLHLLNTYCIPATLESFNSLNNSYIYTYIFETALHEENIGFINSLRLMTHSND